MWDEITYSFPSVNCYTGEVWEWISNFIPYFGTHTYVYLSIPGLKPIHVSKRGAWCSIRRRRSIWSSFIQVEVKIQIITFMTSLCFIQCLYPVLVRSKTLFQYGPVTMIVPAYDPQVRCIPWVQMCTFSEEIGFLCGLKFFALNTFCREYLQSSLHLMLQLCWKPLLWQINNDALLNIQACWINVWENGICSPIWLFP